MNAAALTLALEAEKLCGAVKPSLREKATGVPGLDYWHFRPYQGGENVGLIDWRQSARGDKLYVRERESVQTLSAYFWADPKLANAPPQAAYRAQILLLALARLFLVREHKAAWFEDAPLFFQGLSAFEDFAQVGLQQTLSPARPSPPAMMALPAHALLIFACAFEGDLDAWLALARAASLQRTRLIFLYEREKTDESATKLETLKAEAQKTGFFVVDDPGTDSSEQILLNLANWAFMPF